MSNSELELVVDKMPKVKHMRNSRLDNSLFSKEFAPHYMQLATKLASSDLVPKCYRSKPQDLFLCWSFGYSMGMSPEQAMQCIAIINGKPCMYGDEMLALCMAHKDFEDIIEEPIIKDGIVGYTCIVKRKGRADKESTFTLDMAKKAGLLAKGGVWTQYPARMLQLRARGFCLRDSFPDALKGIKSREEVEDYIDADYKVTESKGSRTELLKNDYLSKKGEQNEDRTSGLCAPSVDSLPGEENQEDQEREGTAESGAHEVEIHTKIKGLIVEKGLTEERLAKALAYYEADCIESLNAESMEHFILQLEKL